MYYREKVIDGVLHFKGHPNASWTPCSKSQLTEQVQRLKNELKHNRNLLDMKDEQIKAYDERFVQAHDIIQDLEKKLLINL